MCEELFYPIRNISAVSQTAFCQYKSLQKSLEKRKH